MTLRPPYVVALLILACTAPSPAEIVESGFGSTSLFHAHAGGRSGQVLSQRVFAGGRGLEPVYALDKVTAAGRILHAISADVDGDGMDDIALIRGGSGRAAEPGTLTTHDGFSGETLYTHQITALGETIVAVVADDFDGDGREEVVVAVDGGRNQARFALIDPYEEAVRDLGLFDSRHLPQASTLLLCSADFDGDHRDDLAVAYPDANDRRGRTSVTLFDVETELAIATARLPAAVPQSRDIIRLQAVRGGSEGRMRLATVVTSIKETTQRVRLYLVGADGAPSLTYDTGEDVDVETHFFADLAGDDSHDLVVVTSTLTADRHRTDVVAVDIPSGAARTIHSIPTFTSNPVRYLGIGVDLDRDGRDEVVVAESSGFRDAAAAKLTAIAADGEVRFEYPDASTPSRPAWIDGLLSGDFDNDARVELLVLYASDEGSGVPVTAILLDENGRPTDDLELGTADARLVVPLVNGITDEELLRAIDMEDPRFDLSRLADRFANGDTEAAVAELYRLFIARGVIESINLIMQDWYYADGTDILISNIHRISTAAAQEFPCHGCHDNRYRSLTAAGRRTGRILATVMHRMAIGERLDQESFITALKALYSQIVWKSRPGNATVANNHGTLFELDSFLPTAIALGMFKALDSPNHRNWLDVIDERLALQFDHVFADGVHDEHSFYYAYRISSSFNRFLALLAGNNSVIQLEPATMAQLQDAIFRLNEYMIYAVKPIEPKLDSEKVYTASDIPVIGDTKGIWVRDFGKQPKDDRFGSFLREPIELGHTQHWTNQELARILSFVADPRRGSPAAFSLPITRYFDQSGIFISRSNWLDAQGFFDYSARYAYFRGGEMIPTQGPYWGYTTWSHHAHADLLSVELSGYNDNLIVESGGLVIGSHHDVIDGFDRSRYTKLYGYESEFDDFLTARHYFKGTAAHSTVYVNRRDQATFVDHFHWSGVNRLRALEPDHLVAEQLDYYSAAIDNGDYAHRRDMYYLKPRLQGLVDDYWLFIDRVTVRDSPGANRVEQIWHISPSQRVRQIDHELGRVGTSNMAIAHADLQGREQPQTEVIGAYNLTDFLRIDSKVVRFVYDESSASEFLFATAIIPFGDSETAADVVLEEIEVIPSGPVASRPDARAFRLAFSKANTRGQVRQIEDHILLSRSPHQAFSWSPGRRGTSSVVTNKRIEIHRRVDGEHAKSMAIDWEGVPRFDILTVNAGHAHVVPQTTSLEQNYPNPFNDSTTIRFAVSARDQVDLSLFSLSGQKVATLVHGLYEAGTYSLRWLGRDDAGRDLASGLYLYRLHIGDWSGTRKLILVK